MKNGLRLSTAFGLAALCMGGCDSTVGLDPTRPSFTGVAVPGACKAEDTLGQVDVSVILLGQDGEGILPGDSVQRESRSVAELLTASSFQWEQIDAEFPGAQASAAGVDSGLNDGVGLLSNSVSYAFTGGEDRKNDARLIVFAVDHSGSLIGEDLVNGGVDINSATDIRDERIAFFRTLVGQLSPSVFLSLVSFQGQLPIIDDGENNDGPAVPTRNRDIIIGALTDLESGSSGTTPLSRTLADTLTSVLLPNIKKPNGDNDLNGALVLFTDGVETGDPTDTDDRAGLDKAIADYKAAGVPVFVVQLEPPPSAGYPLGRDAKLVELACATGGEHIFVEDPKEFTDPRSNLPNLLKNRLRGAWKVRTTTTLSNPTFPSDTYLVSTQLKVALGAVAEHTARLALSRDSQRDFEDTRLWFAK